MVNIASRQWDSNPTITVGLAYDHRRSGSDMQYRIKVTVEPVSGASHFGYPLYCSIDLAGKPRISAHKLKGAHPSQWSDAIVYTTDWMTVPDRSTGTVQLDVTIYSGDGYSRSRTYSHRLKVDPGASVLSAPDGTLGEALTLSVTRYVSGSKHNVIYRCGDYNDSIVRDSTSTSISWTPPLYFANVSPRSSTVTVQLEIATYKDGVKLGETQTTTIRCAIPVSVKPTASLALSDAAGLTGYGGYIQGQSRLKAVLSGSGAYGSTIRGYSIKAAGETSSSSALTVDLPTAGSVAITGTVTDTRSRTGKDTKTINVLPYQRPRITKLVEGRCDSNGSPNSKGDHCKVTYSAEITPLSGKNHGAYKLQYRPSGTDYWTEIQLTTGAKVTDGTAVFAASIDDAYELRIAATDDFGTRTSTIHTLPRAYQIIDTDGDALGFGQRCEDPRTAAFGVEIRVNKGMTTGGKSLVDWEPVPLRPVSTSAYTVAIERDSSEWLPGQGQVMISAKIRITVKTAISAGEKIPVATLDKAGIWHALDIYPASTNPRVYTGHVGDGRIFIQPNTEMGAAEYVLFVDASYRFKE